MHYRSRYASNPSTSTETLSANNASQRAAPNASSTPPPSPPILYRIADYCDIERDLLSCTLCELFCSFFLMYGGASIGATYVISGSTFKYSMAIGWGLWLIFCLYLGFNISGSHLNPAISFMHFFVLRKISFKRFLCYSLAQFCGFFLGSALAFFIYYEGINHFDGGVRAVNGPTATANIFATYPERYLSVYGGIVDQTLTTAVLCLKAICITDKKNRIPRQIQPLLLGISLWTIVAFWSQNCGAALNPARDFGPRIFTLVAGYGWEVISYNNYQWFWVPIIAPMLGALLGGYTYQRFIGDYLEDASYKIRQDQSILPLFDAACRCVCACGGGGSRENYKRSNGDTPIRNASGIKHSRHSRNEDANNRGQSTSPTEAPSLPVKTFSSIYEAATPHSSSTTDALTRQWMQPTTAAKTTAKISPVAVPPFNIMRAAELQRKESAQKKLALNITVDAKTYAEKY